MKKVLILTLTIMSFIGASHESQASSTALEQWGNLTSIEKAEILTFEYDIKIPNVKVITLTYGTPLDIQTIRYLPYRNFAANMVDTFVNSVNREEIEQSDYSPSGEPIVVELQLLVTDKKEILGGKIALRQEGQTQDGDQGDINWRASLRVNENAEVLRDEEQTPFDTLSYEWTGH